MDGVKVENEAEGLAVVGVETLAIETKILPFRETKDKEMTILRQIFKTKGTVFRTTHLIPTIDSITLFVLVTTYTKDILINAKFKGVTKPPPPILHPG